MSNPTEFGTNELPDLDREWLALALLKKFWKGYEWAGVTREEAARIDAAFETLARRAQPEGEARREYTEAVAREAWAIVCNNSKGMPDNMQAAIRDALLAPLYSHSPAVKPEGEAPQAVLRDEHRATIEEAAQVLESAATHNREKGRTVLEREQQDRANRLRAILAAQHAESGAQAPDQRERFEAHYKGLAAAGKLLGLNFNRTPLGNYDHAYVGAYWHGWQAAVAAQSQDTGLAKLALEQAKARLAQADARIEELEAAQSQGAQAALREAADYCDQQRAGTSNYAGQCADVIRQKLMPKYAAQQAAAPGALPDRFHWSKRGMELDPNGYYVAYSAPGTPEAPKSAAADEWSFSTDEEHYRDPEPTRAAILRHALAEIVADEDEPAATVFWIGRNVRYSPSIDADWVIEQMQEQAHEWGGEFAETFMEDVTDAETAELKAMIDDWAARVDRSNFWTVTAVEKFTIESARAEIEAIQRAAQLDGGQGEGAGHVD